MSEYIDPDKLRKSIEWWKHEKRTNANNLADVADFCIYLTESELQRTRAAKDMASDRYIFMFVIILGVVFGLFFTITRVVMGL